MTANDYERALQKARSDLDKCLRQRGEIDRQIMQLKATVEALAAQCEPQQDYSIPEQLDNEYPKGFGITLAIRKCLSESKASLPSATQIRDALVNSGLDLSNYANAMAVIHNTLKRLQEQGEVSVVMKPFGGVLGYYLNQGPPPVNLVTPGQATEIPKGMPLPPGYIRNDKK